MLHRHSLSGVVQLNQAPEGRGLHEVTAHDESASLSLSPKTHAGKGRSIQLQPPTSDDLHALRHWALNDGHEGKGNQVLPRYVLSPCKNVILYVILYL